MSIPAPSGALKTPQAFLKACGRQLEEHVEAFPSWDALFTTKSPQLKAAGIDVAARKHLLAQVEHYRQTGEVSSVKQSKKLNGGERKLNAHLAKKTVLERIDLAKTQKLLRKQSNATARLEAGFAKLHNYSL